MSMTTSPQTRPTEQTTRPPCRRVTGRAFEPRYWEIEEKRQGPRRPKDEVNPSKQSWYTSAPTEPVYDVLCGQASEWTVVDGSGEPVTCCHRCLVPLLQTLRGAIGVERIGRVRR